MALADFSRASALGFEQGQQMQEGQNPLGTFVRGMLEDYKQKKQMESEYGMKTALNQQEYGMKKDLAVEEAKLKQQYPSMMDTYIAKQMGISMPGEQNNTDTGNQNGTNTPQILQAPAKSIEEAKQRIIKEGKDPNDYLIKEEKVMMGKIPTVGYSINERQRKPLPQAQMKSIEDAQYVISNLKNIEDKANNFKTGPLAYRFSQNPGSQAYMGIAGTPEEATYKSDLTDTQAAYASARTGAQRGFKEIQWLEAAMPSSNLPPDKMVAVAKQSRLRMEKNLNNILSVAKKSGYDVSQFGDATSNGFQINPIQEQTQKKNDGFETTPSGNKYKIVK